MNETLEAMGRAFFKSWFVDFDPVRAKAAGRDPGLPKSLADLFPDSFEDSELGEIPKGWKVRSLYETAEFINGAAFKSEDFCEPGFGLPIVKIAELKDGISGQTKSSDRVLDPKQLIDTGELLYSWSGSPDTSLDAFLWTRGRGLLNQHIFKVVTPSIGEKRFVCYLLKFLRPTLVEIARNKQTTGLGHVTVADMKRLYVCSPPLKVLGAFDNQVAPLFDKAFQNTIEDQTLAALRDTLLPKLISGELRVRNAEKMVGVVA
jgi:type I restriction enzyme S subunit